MRKQTAGVALLFFVLLVVYFVQQKHHSEWDISGKVTEVQYLDETSMSLTVETNLFTKTPIFYLTVNQSTDINFNGASISLKELQEVVQNGYKIQAVVGDSVLMSSPPVVLAEIVKVKGR